MLERARRPPVVPRGPMPYNANVKGCEWYGEQRTVTVHLWGAAVKAESSYDGSQWMVRHCVVCGVLDVDDLRDQYERDQYEQRNAVAEAFG